MKHSWKSKLCAIVLPAAMVAPAGAHAQTQAQTATRTYAAYGVDIPFKFAVGSRTFSPGNYKFAVLGPGLLAVLNTKTRVVVRLLTRDAQPVEEPATAGLIFANDKKGRRRLTSVRLDSQARGLQIIGEEVPMRRDSPLQFEPPIPMDLFPPGPRERLQRPIL